MDWLSQPSTLDVEMTGYDQEMNKLNAKLSFGKQNPDHNRQLRYSSNDFFSSSMVIFKKRVVLGVFYLY